MRVIDLDKPSSERRTVCAYGATRSGKTHWAATAPRPLFFSDATESGWTTISNMDRSLWFEPDVKPIVWGLETVTDMASCIANAYPLVQGGKVRTIVIDSLSFYADLYLAFQYSKSSDTRKIYGDLGIHLRDTRVKLHNMPVNVIWLCLVKDPDEENKAAGPLIPGQQASKFAAGVDNILYFRRDAEKYLIHTKQRGAYIAGGREGQRVIADPLPAPTFKSYLTAIGDPEQSLDVPIALPPPPQVAQAPIAQRVPVVQRAPIRAPVRAR